MAEWRGNGLTSQRSRERLVRELKVAGIRDPNVLDAIREVPRHLFVEEALTHRAYENIALPIGYRQTISQPYVVARMSECAVENAESCHSVLEIGTGSGYQAAVLSRLFDRVYSIERIQALSRSARELLTRLKINNVSLRHGDGNLGWPERAPFDAILLTAAPREVPHVLLTQLAQGGRLIAPVGEPDGPQSLEVYRFVDDAYVREVLDSVVFVPMLPGVDT